MMWVVDDARMALLEEEVESLRRVVADRDARLAARDAQVEQLVAALGTVVAERDEARADLIRALRRAFARRSEKLDPAQLALSFEDLADGVLAAAPARQQEPQTTAPDDEEPPPARRRRKPGGVRVLSPDLPRERREVLPPEEERRCSGCGEQKARIGEEIAEELDYVPAHLRVIEHVRVKMACRRCESGVVIGHGPLRPIPRSKASAGLLAHVTVSKYVDHLPLHRQEKMLARAGMSLVRQTLCDWIAGVAEQIGPLVRVIEAQVIDSGYVRADETGVRILRTGKKGKSHQGYVWAYLGGGAVAYRATLSRARDGPSGFLEDLRGVLQVDGYVGYDEISGKDAITRAGCMAHARRGFHEALGNDPAAASLVLGLIQRLYAVESEAREAGLSAAETRALRQRQSAPVMKRLHALLHELEERALPSSLLGKAVSYALGQWEYLRVFLEHGHVAIDNNHVENAVRGIAVGRKNWLFAGSPAGAERAAAIYTLTQSAKMAGVDPLAYLTDVLARLPGTPVSQVAALTPRAWAAARAG
jgi:transposase